MRWGYPIGSSRSRSCTAWVHGDAAVPARAVLGVAGADGDLPPDDVEDPQPQVVGAGDLLRREPRTAPLLGVECDRQVLGELLLPDLARRPRHVDGVGVPWRFAGVEHHAAEPVVPGQVLAM